MSAEPAEAAAVAWKKALAAADYDAVLRELDELPRERAETPEMRYVRARAKLAVGDFAGALELLSVLPRELPILAGQIARDRAECGLSAGPFPEAATYFESQADPASLVLAASALEKSGNGSRARTLLDRALGAIGNASDPELIAIARRARAARARMARASGDTQRAISDWRYLAVEAPSTEEGRIAAERLAAEVPRVSLTPDERLSRARGLAEAGALDGALSELDGLEKQGALPGLVILRARAQAHYLARTSYRTAAELYDKAARSGDREAAHDAFYAARALARADDDAHAIERYEALSARYPASPFAEEARYQAARLRFTSSRFPEAIAAYEKYLTTYGARGGGRFRSAVREELSLAQLAAGRGADAARLLHAVAEASEDSLERARLRELEAVALSPGDRAQAIELFGAVIRDRPLSFPALASAARLRDLGVTVPLRGPDAGSGPTTPFDVDLPGDVELLSRLGFAEDAERLLAAHEKEIVARYAPRGYEALCAAYGRIGSGAARLRVGRAAVKKETFDKLPSDETRWAWECAYPEPYLAMVSGAEEHEHLPAGILLSVMRQESAFRSTATSPASAVGLLQLLPTTGSRVASELGLESCPELFVPAHNVRIGAHYLGRLLDRFGGQAVLAVAAYNAGPRAVSRWLEAAETLPLDLWVARIPFAETRGYVVRVIGNLSRYAFLYPDIAEMPALPLTLPTGLRAIDSDY